MNEDLDDNSDPITDLLAEVPAELHTRMDGIGDVVEKHGEMLSTSIRTLISAIEGIHDLDDDTFLLYAAHPSIGSIPRAVFGSMRELEANAVKLIQAAGKLQMKIAATRIAMQRSR
jgi:hypothetical protein